MEDLSVLSTDSLAVLSRLKHVLAADSDASLAKTLDISPQTLASWKARRSVPYSLCVDLAQERGISLDWLLLGLGTMLRVGDSEPSDVQETALLATLRCLGPEDRQQLHQVVLEKKRLRDLERRLATMMATPNRH